MLQALACKPKVIAWSFVWIFYLQLILPPFAAKANARPLPQWRSSYTNNIWKKDITSNVKQPVKEMAAKSPTHVRGGVTTGPVQPETQSFQSVNNNNLVDLFTGDFSYNIPLLDVGGYPVNLHYQSGITMDQEASWVGLGWNVNPGVVSRNMRGLPDDFKGMEDSVKKVVSI